MNKSFSLLIPFIFLSLSLSAQSDRDWAQFYRYEQSNSEIVASGQKPRAVFIGDSITDSWDEMHHQFFTDNNFIGRGISGQTSSQMLVRFRKDVLDLKPKYVLILAGTNDIARNNGIISLENIFGNIASMCELAKLHKIKPVLCSIIPSSDYYWRPEVGNPSEIIITMNKMLQEYAKANHFIYLDYHSVLKDEINGLRTEYRKILPDGTPDAVHPSVVGYRLMEKVVLDNLK